MPLDTPPGRCPRTLFWRQNVGRPISRGSLLAEALLRGQRPRNEPVLEVGEGKDDSYGQEREVGQPLCCAQEPPGARGQPGARGGLRAQGPGHDGQHCQVADPLQGPEGTPWPRGQPTPCTAAAGAGGGAWGLAGAPEPGGQWLVSELVPL